MRVGILGGTFNPVHQGHLFLAQGALEKIPLDQVLWVPAHLPPHKEKPQGATAEDRCRMVELAIQEYPSFRVSRVELDRSAPSYTIDTLRQLQTQWPERQTDWFFLVGSDTALELPTWRQIDELVKRVTFIAVPRPGSSSQPLSYGIQEIPVKTLNISSSDIRAQIKRGESIQGLVPESVRHYIEQHKLYQ